MMWLILMSLITKLHCVVSLLAAIRVAFCETFSFNSFSHSCCAIIYTNLMDSASNNNVEWIYWKQLREANRALLRMQKKTRSSKEIYDVNSAPFVRRFSVVLIETLTAQSSALTASQLTFYFLRRSRMAFLVRRNVLLGDLEESAKR